MSNQTELINTFAIIIVIVMLMLFFAGIALFYVIYKEKKSKKNNNDFFNNDIKTDISNKAQNKQSIFKFMEFENVEDNMIIQKNGNKYLMIIECKGINYDLMSGIEKNGVEIGFVQFLNSLRFPIQIYIQTRTINLENSIQIYKRKVKEVEDKYNRMKLRYNQMQKSNSYTEEELARMYFELTKQHNLFEYGNSVIQDTERMSLNKNILNKSYYIIVPYYSAEAGNDKLDKEEIKNIAFSELYTRCQAIISSLYSCDVRGRILRTNEIIELLYMAYNRDEAEVFGLDKAIKAGYNELYSTGSDAYEKKMKELDKIIEQKAKDIAKDKIFEAKSEIQKRVEEKEQNIDQIIKEAARLFLQDNESYIGTEVKELAIEKLDNSEKGGTKDVKKTRTKKKNTAI